MLPKIIVTSDAEEVIDATIGDNSFVASKRSKREAVRIRVYFQSGAIRRPPSIAN